MNIFVPTFIILAACIFGMAIGLFFKRKPLEKRCGSDPDEACTCKGDERKCD